jgi:hypothetical protein
VRLTTLPPSCAEFHENLGAYTSWNPLGHTGPVTGLLYHFINNLDSEDVTNCDYLIVADECVMIFRNVGNHSPNDTALHLTRSDLSYEL